MIIITHSDPDGVFCTYLLLKKYGDVFKIYYSNPRNINKDILEIIKHNDKNEDIFITDIAVNQELIFLSSYFKRVYIIDHHKIDNNLELTSRVSLYIKYYKSAARVVSEYLNIESNLLDFIDDIDSNEINNDKERDFRDLFVAIRHFHLKDYPLYFNQVARDLYLKEDIDFIINKNINLIKDFRKILDKELKTIYERSIIINENNKKLIIIKSKLNIPSNYYLEKIKEIFGNVDYVITLYDNSKRGEIRTLNNSNVLELARFLGGGGHELASGFSYNSDQEVINKIKYFLNK